MPKPEKGETKDAFISRFMSDERMEKEYPDKEQRAAVAFDMWRKNGL